MSARIRTFDTGATRDLDTDKLDYEGFLAPIVLERFAQYMHQHRQTAAGWRDSDNWQKGIPIAQYVKSLLRHVMTVWLAHRRGEPLPQEELCAMLFNAQGLLFEVLNADPPGGFDDPIPTAWCTDLEPESR